MSLGLIQEYNREWPLWFEQIKDSLEEFIEGKFISIEHIGSTSIVGMNAKPIIDIDIIIDKSDFSFIKNRLDKIGYLHEGDLGIKGREAFDLIDLNKRKALPNHHLYVCYKGEFELKKHLAFRNYLRTNILARNKLMELKRKLEQTCKTKEEYIEGKSSLVHKITIAAMDEYDGHQVIL